MLRELPELAGARLALAAARAASAHLCQGATFAPGSRYLHRRGPAPLGGSSRSVSGGRGGRSGPYGRPGACLTR